MKKYLIGASLFIAALSPAFAQASVLTQSQIGSILQILQSFGVSQSVITNVQNALNGGTIGNQQSPGSTAPAGSGGTTSGVAPNITLIYPTVISVSDPKDITGYGSNLQPGMSIVYSGSSSGFIQPSYISKTKFKFSSGGFSAGSYSFVVKNPNGKTSGGLSFKIVSPSAGGINNPGIFQPPPPTPPPGAIPPGPSCGGAIITPATPPVANYSSCNLPGGGTLSVGQGTDNQLYWKINGSCYGANFVCGSTFGLTPGSQFSPMPPQPAVGDMIYSSQSNCNSGIGGVPKGNGNSSGSSGGGATVNGACGVSACASFNSAPTTNLCSSGTASTATGSGPFNWTCTGGNGGSSVRCSAGKNSTGTTPPPVTQPPPSGCGTEDKFMSSMPIQGLYPWPPMTVPAGTSGYSIKFIADINNISANLQAGDIPIGVSLGMTNESNIGNKPVEVVISTCAHSFTPVNNSTACSGGFWLLYMPSPAQPLAYDCQLQTGGTYYINTRTADFSASYGVQFGATARRLLPPGTGNRQ